MNNLQGNFGNINYKAPEMFLNQPYNGIMTDVFSLGQILINIAGGIFGFKSARQNDDYYRLIIEQHFDQYWFEIGKKHNLILSQDFQNLFIRMVSPNPAQRPTIEQILNDPWMQEINDLNEEQKK